MAINKMFSFSGLFDNRRLYFHKSQKNCKTELSFSNKVLKLSFLTDNPDNLDNTIFFIKNHKIYSYSFSVRQHFNYEFQLV